MTALNVSLKGKWLNRVYYNTSCDADYVRQSLINHDGYDPEITVRKVK